MKETVKASLAGIGFVFDTDAFELLEGYLDKLSQSYSANPDGEEIIADIEARIVELILSHQSAETVVGLGLIDEITDQLGAPEESGGQLTDRADSREDAFPRRLYRDRENRKLGGVCSGLARYFDIDPVLVRVAMFIPVFLLIILPTMRITGPLPFLGSMFGAFCLLYLLLWIAVPAARTPRQKLEMQGRRITASEIEREITSGAAREPYEGGRSAGATFLGVLGAIFLFCVKFFLIIIGGTFGLAALVIVVAILGLAVGAPWVVTTGMAGEDFILRIGSMSMPTAGFSMMILGLIAIPIIMLVYQMIRVSLSRRNNQTLMWILGGGWILLALFTGITILENGDIFRHWHGVKFESRRSVDWGPGVRNTDSDEGWEIYERNVQLYRDSLEKVRAETPAATGIGDGGMENEIIFDRIPDEELSPSGIE